MRFIHAGVAVGMGAVAVDQPITQIGLFGHLVLATQHIARDADCDLAASRRALVHMIVSALLELAKDSTAAHADASMPPRMGIICNTIARRSGTVRSPV